VKLRVLAPYRFLKINRKKEIHAESLRKKNVFLDKT
jgi:hypothetical protein